MASSHSIAPFPDEINREAFAWAVTGFTAGEGCFDLRAYAKQFGGHSRLTIKLRDDDADTIYLIQSFFRCGCIRRQAGGRKDTNGNPSIIYCCENPVDISRVIVPHFEAYPLSILRSKKHRDFLIFREGHAILRRVSRKPKIGIGRGGGSYPKWNSADSLEFQDCIRRMKEVRAYDSSPLPEASGSNEGSPSMVQPPLHLSYD